MDEYGFVNNLDLAKSILIMYFSNKFILERELVTKIKMNQQKLKEALHSLILMVTIILEVLIKWMGM